MPNSKSPPTTTFQRITRSNSQNDVTLDNIKVLIENSKTEIINSVKDELTSIIKKVAALSSRVDMLEKDNETLENKCHDLLKTVTRQHKIIEDQLVALDSGSRKSSFIIRNFPEGDCMVDGKFLESAHDAVTVVAEALGIPEEVKEVKEAFRLGKMRPNGRNRLIMVKTTEKTVKAFLRKARTLKQREAPLNKVFLHEDLPPVVTKKLAEMRKRAHEHRIQHPNEEAFVKNKKLYLNGVIVDEIAQNF